MDDRALHPELLSLRVPREQLRFSGIAANPRKVVPRKHPRLRRARRVRTERGREGHDHIAFH